MKLYRSIASAGQIPRTNSAVSPQLAARLLNVNRSTIVLWEEKGLLKGERRNTGIRSERYYIVEHLLEQAKKHNWPVDDSILLPEPKPITPAVDSINV